MNVPTPVRKLGPFVVLAVAGLLLFRGGAAADGKDHYTRALGYERQLLRENPETGYGHPGYVHVLRELARVPRSAPDRARADQLAQRISDGRRFAAARRLDQVDLPPRLEGTEEPQPPRPAPEKSDASGRPGTKVRRTTAAARRGLQAKADSAVGELTKAQLGKLDIRMYSTAWCGYCKKARRYFTSQGWPYVDKDVERDPAAADEFRSVAGGRGGVPVIVINGQVLRGFSPVQIDRAVARAVEGT